MLSSFVARRLLPLAFAVPWVGLSAAHAGLTWAQKTVDLKADATTEVLEAHFHFTNSGSTPVDIRQVESSCGCTTTELSRRHYEPGEGGEIVARYTIGGHMGLQKKTIAVSSSDQSDFTTLTMVAHIPEIARFEPSFVTWTHDEAAKQKKITLEMLQEVAPRDITVQSSNASVTAEVRPVVKGHKYELVVQPARTSVFVHATLTVRCRFGGQEQSFRTYATVQPPVSRP